MMIFDSAEWTGRRPYMPLLRFEFMCRHFMISIGPDAYQDAFTVRLAWRQNSNRQDYESYWLSSKVWCFVSRRQVVSGSW